MKQYTTTIDGRQIVLYENKKPDSPLVVLISYYQMAAPVMKVCHTLDPSARFSVLTFADLNWDEDLSPWPHEPVVEENDHFTGNAPEFLKTVIQSVEWAKKTLGHHVLTIIAGYSMGGLFSLYAPYETSLFDAVVCASGSVWYPGFYRFATTNSMKGAPRAIYLSLGKKEPDTRNPYLSQTGVIMEKLNMFYKEIHIPCVFEWNPGNHFVNGDLRLAKGIVWSLQQLSA